jgi:hypothetical protein
VCGKLISSHVMDFSVRKIIFFTPSKIRGCEEKKSKCVENGHKKFEITRKIKKRNLVFGY